MDTGNITVITLKVNKRHQLAVGKILVASKITNPKTSNAPNVIISGKVHTDRFIMVGLVNKVSAQLDVLSVPNTR